MDSLTITRLALADPQMKRGFGGVYPKDKLPHSRRHYQSFVVNTHPSTKRGEHWQAVYFDKHNHAHFFCSFGNPPIAQVKNFIIRNCISFDFNPHQYQHNRTTSCGLFCLFYLWHRTRGLPISQLRIADVCANENLIRQFARRHLKTLSDVRIGVSVQHCQPSVIGSFRVK